MTPARYSHLLAAFVFVVVSGDAAAASAQGRGKLDKALQTAVDETQGAAKHRVIVRARAGYIEWLKQQLAEQGAVIGSEHPSIDAVSVELDSQDVERWSTSTAVASVSLDSYVWPTARPLQQQLRQRSLEPDVNTVLGTLGLAPNRDGGRGITVALIDSGLHPSRAFAYRIKAFYDFTGGQAVLRRPFDDYGHGTHVAGLIGGNQNAADSEFEGVAPGVEFVVLKVLDGTGRGNTSDVIRAIDFATAHAGDDSTRWASTSSISRWDTPSSNPRRPIPSSSQSKRPRRAAFLSSLRPATSAAIQ